MDKRQTEAVWRETLSLISSRVNDGTYRIWFEPTVGLGFSDESFIVGVASPFAKDWIDTRFRALISDCLSEVLGDTVSCRIVLSPELADRYDEEESSLKDEGTGDPPAENRDQAARSPLLTPVPDASGATGDPAPSSQSAGASPDPPAVATPSLSLGLNGKYTFDSFVIGPSNRFAHAAALAVAETPGRAYNPLFVYGGVGLGKTHLLQAIGQFVTRHTPHLRVRFVTIEMFTNDFINSLRDDSIEGFKKRYRTNDVLLIDDIQFLERKEQTQEEFFHTFNTLFEAGKQIVISSDRPPKALHTLEERLVSRFHWGLITDIQPPDLETRIAILRKKVGFDEITLQDDDVLSFIASRVPDNIRELEGCLNRVVAFSSFSGQPIDVSLARRVLQDIPETPERPITVELILNIVSEATNISVAEMKANKRTRPIVRARHLAMYLARELTDLSLPRIGDSLGGRDHTTVLHAVEKIATMMHEDRELYNLVQRLTTEAKRAR